MEPAPVPLSRWRRLGLFVIVVAAAGIVGAAVEWTVRWVLPSVAAVFLGRAATIYPVFYWMPVILGEDPPWSRRRRVRFAILAAVVLAGLDALLGA